MTISADMKNWLVKHGYADSGLDRSDDNLWVDAVEKAASEAVDFAHMLRDDDVELVERKTAAEQVFGSVRLKKASERYSHKKSVALHKTTGLPVTDERGRQVETTSQKELALCGAFMKSIAVKSGVSEASLDEHDKELLHELYTDHKWAGKIGNEYVSELDGSRVKSLLDDSASGGLELVPIVFDEAIVQTPLLFSEVLPYVDLREVSRGSRVEGASIANVEATFGTPEGTAITPFDTADMVSALDTDIERCTASCEVGRDMLADSPAAVGSLIVEGIGMSMLNKLDTVIAMGNGTTEPLGLSVASGLTDIGNPAGGAGAAIAIVDLEEMLFSVGKEVRQKAWNCSYVCNDTWYQRARSIAVGAADQRLVFGMNVEDYTIFGRKVCIVNALPNNEAYFGALKRYRLYRRQGQSVRITTEGRELALKNHALYVVTMRVGGRPVQADAWSYSDNFQA
ncbi:phage major capsid protein [Aeoliella sp.]|uniref:phage major capsid protein n=1 Tax=Aeoliella sp. TaxID=2795800 RepID=UPI003CCBEA8B